MNVVALHWLHKSDEGGNLIDIVRTEYSAQLKSGVQLAHLVPTIAYNIDSLLSRHSSSSVQKAGVNEEHDDGDNIEEEADVMLSQQGQRYQRKEGQAIPTFTEGDRKSFKPLTPGQSSTMKGQD